MRLTKRQLSSEEIFRTMTVPQAVRTMAVPAVMSQIIVLIYNLADTFFIGRTNNPYMVAGVSLILPLFNVCLAIGSMFGTGGGALLPKLLAREQREEGTCVAAYCIRLGLLTAVGFSILTLVFMHPPDHCLQCVFQSASQPQSRTGGRHRCRPWGRTQPFS